MARYAGRDILRYFRGEAAFALPGLDATLEADDDRYAIRLPTIAVLRKKIALSWAWDAIFSVAERPA